MPATSFAADSNYQLEVDGVALDGADLPGDSIAEVTGPDIESVKFVLDGKYLGEVTSAPFQQVLELSPGEHRLRARIKGGGSVTARFTVGVSKPTTKATTPPATRSSSPPPEISLGAETVAVASTAELEDALASAQPGQTIRLADGTYKGRFMISGSGTDAAPISLVGSRSAVIDGGTGGYTVNLVEANHWNLVGFTVTGGEKGIMTDESNNNVLSDLDVGNTGMEAVHFRNFSSNNILQNSDIHDTGGKKAAFGEGVYIGTAKSNLKAKTSTTGGAPDASNNNQILNNRIYNVTAENIDIKEGSSGGLIRGNELDGSAVSGDNFADSLIDVKGNDYEIIANTAIGGTGAMVDLFQTHEITNGSGQGNVFSANDLGNVAVDGYGINVTKGVNTITCDNTATGAAKGVSNIECSG